MSAQVGEVRVGNNSGVWWKVIHIEGDHVVVKNIGGRSAFLYPPGTTEKFRMEKFLEWKSVEGLTKPLSKFAQFQRKIAA